MRRATWPSANMHLARFILGCLTALWRQAMLTTSAVAARRERLWRRMAQHAAAHVPFYRKLYAGLDLSTCRLTDLPTVSKAQLMEEVEQTTVEGLLAGADLKAFGRDRQRVGQEFHRSLILSTTSGTTGMVGYFVSSRGEFEYMRGTLFGRLLSTFLRNPVEFVRYGPWNRLRMGFVTATGGHYITYLLSLHSPTLARMMWRPAAFSILTPVPQLCRQLEEYQPHLLHGYPTFMEALAHEQINGRLSIAPRVISLSSEPFTSTARAAMAAAWPQTRLLETYGTTECVCMASPCSQGSLHINEDVCVLESVDGNGNPVADGQLGSHVLLTNLVTKAQPIVRYEIGDQVVIQGTRCPCGSPFRTVRVMGRTDDTFFLKGPDSLFHAHTPIPFEVLFLELEGLRQYQLVHERQNHLHVHYTRDPRVDAAALHQRVVDVFGRYLADNNLQDMVEVTVTETDEIHRDPNTKKIRQIVSRVAVPAAEELSGPWRAPPRARAAG